jgi:hypothetical protein
MAGLGARIDTALVQMYDLIVLDMCEDLQNLIVGV